MGALGALGALGASACSEDAPAPVTQCDPATLSPDVATELEPVPGQEDFGFIRLFHPDLVGDAPIDGTFGFWAEPAFALYRLTLGDSPSLARVDALDPAAMGFSGFAVDGKYYACQGVGYAECQLHEVDPVTNDVRELFTMPGLLGHLARLSGGEGEEPDLFAVTSVIITPEGRTTYVTTTDSLEVESITLDDAIELAGNGVVMVFDGSVYVGAAESPTVTRYTPSEEGALEQTGVLNLAAQGLARYPFGSVIASADRAFAVDDATYQVVVWNPTTMTYVDTIDLTEVEGFELPGYPPEFWTTSVHDGRLYVPVRYVSWTAGAEDVPSIVKLLIYDTESLALLGVAEDDRCHNGGRPVFDTNGDAYVVADGRNWSAQLYACLAGEPTPPNCILRIEAGETDFDPSYLVEIPDIVPAD